MATESDALRQVCDYLQLRKKKIGFMFWRTNNTPIWQEDRFRAIPKYSMKGVPDVIVIKDGFFIGLEIKTKAGRQSDHQKEFEKQCKENGAEYYIVRGLDDVIEIGL